MQLSKWAHHDVREQNCECIPPSPEEIVDEISAESIELISNNGLSRIREHIVELFIN